MVKIALFVIFQFIQNSDVIDQSDLAIEFAFCIIKFTRNDQYFRENLVSNYVIVYIVY